MPLSHYHYWSFPWKRETFIAIAMVENCIDAPSCYNLRYEGTEESGYILTGATSQPSLLLR
jgi:hypothetical protein